MGCGTSVMTVEIENQSVTISWEPTPGQSCGPKGLWEQPWMLVDDGNSVVWKIHHVVIHETAKSLVVICSQLGKVKTRHGAFHRMQPITHSVAHNNLWLNSSGVTSTSMQLP
jgi:hypothetical protein